jgi:hypothetical protein
MVMGVCPSGARSEDGGGKRGPRHDDVVWPLFGWRRLRQGAVGVGERVRRVEEAGHEQGGPCRPMDSARSVAALNQRARATCAVRAWPTEQRGRGEADRWAAATVPGGGTDR